MLKNTLITILVAVTLGCGYSKADLDTQLFYQQKAVEATELRDDIKVLQDAYFAEAEPRWWNELEKSFTTTETTLRNQGVYDQKASTKLRQRYLAAVDELRLKITDKKAQYAKLYAKADNQRDGWAKASDIIELKRNTDAEVTKYATDRFTEVAAEIVAMSAAAKAAQGNAVSDAPTGGGNTKPPAVVPDPVPQNSKKKSSGKNK